MYLKHDAWLDKSHLKCSSHQSLHAKALALALALTGEEGGYTQVLLEAVMPEKMAELATALGTSDMPGHMQERAQWGGMQPGQKVTKVALFPRVNPPE